MNALLTIALSNLLVACVFGVCAIFVHAFWRRPALVHGLWLLFFLKLLTPPLYPVAIPWRWPTQEASECKTNIEESTPAIRAATVRERRTAPVPDVDPQETFIEPLATSDQPPIETMLVANEPVQTAPEPTPFAQAPPIEIPWLEIVAGIWPAGSLGWFLLAGVRLDRFHQRLRFGKPAPDDLQSEAGVLADRMGITTPQVWVLPGALSPMLWVSHGTPRLLIPEGLLARLDNDQRQALLVHELAHWRRGDHWVRRLELVVLMLYWWCPLVWWARRHLQEAEEECCDAWVVWMMPGAARGYALALLETVDFMASVRAVLPPVASGIGHVRLLKRRLTMIMQGTTPRALTLSGGLAVLGLGAILLPLIPSWGQQPPADFGRERASAAQSETIRSEQEAIDRSMREFKRLQLELERSRKEIETRSRDLQQKLDKLQMEQRVLEQMEAAKRQERRALAAVQEAQRIQAQRNQNDDVAPVKPGGRAGATGNDGSDIEKRLRAVERKLDMLIQMMQRKGPAVNPAMAPGGLPPKMTEPVGVPNAGPIHPPTPTATPPLPSVAPVATPPTPKPELAPEAPAANAPSIASPDGAPLQSNAPALPRAPQGPRIAPATPVQ